MDEAQALRELDRKLIFGDEKQIAAIKFLRDLNEAEVAWVKCYHRYQGIECSCLARFSDDVCKVIWKRDQEQQKRETGTTKKEIHQK